MRFERHGHFAGDDSTRLSALLECANDPEVDAVWFAMGGYGANRISADAIEGMSMDQIFAFATDDIAAMTSAQVDAMFAATPIMLDLDGDGVRTVSAQDGVQFDINATGTEHQRRADRELADRTAAPDRDGVAFLDGFENSGDFVHGWAESYAAVWSASIILG